MALCKSAIYYRKNKKARDKKKAYDTKYNKKTIGDRVKRNAARKQLGLKVGDPRDASHTTNGVVAKHKSKNRGSKTDMPGDKRARGGKK